MSHEGGPEPTQRTVAELLAKYGQETGERAPRRRRRRADDDDTGAQAIIDRVISESGEMPIIRDDTPPPERTSHRHRTDFQRPVEPRRRQPPPPPSAGPPTVATSGPLLGPPTGSRIPPAGPPSGTRIPQAGPPSGTRIPPAPPPAAGRRAAPDSPRGHQSSQQLPKPPQPSQQLPIPKSQTSQQLPKPPQPSQQLRTPPPSPPGQRSGVQPSLRSRLDGEPPAPPTQMIPPVAAKGPVPEPMTEELPRVPTYPSMDPAAERRPGQDSRTRLTPAVAPQREPFPSGPQPVAEPDYRGGFPDRGFDPDAERDFGREFERDFDSGRPVEDGDRAFDDLDDDLARELDELEGDRPPRPAMVEWLVMIGQLALGVLGGAAVWLGFNWLWGALPQAALVLALAVIAGMVFIVRRIRKAEDLQTTVYAVLVGLLATVSPAALLLLNR